MASFPFIDIAEYESRDGLTRANVFKGKETGDYYIEVNGRTSSIQFDNDDEAIAYCNQRNYYDKGKRV